MKKAYFLPLIGFLMNGVMASAHAIEKPNTMQPLENPTLLPLENPAQWQLLTYEGITANQVSIKHKIAKIKVKASASPLIYPFQRPLSVNSIQFQVQIKGNVSLHGKQQGNKGADDSVFRLGIVYEGNNRMGIFEQQLAPQWVKTLYALAPQDSGIDFIEFHNVYSDKRMANVKRQHPLSSLLMENYTYSYEQFRDSKGSATITGMIKLEAGKKVLALWVSSDGDDTQSHYDVTIQKLTIN